MTVKPAYRLFNALLFSGMLSIAFLDHNRFYLSWFAFTPLLFAIDKTTLKTTYLLSLTAGMGLFVSATYWIADFITIAKGTSDPSDLMLACFYWLYCAHIIALPMLLINWLRANTNIHDFIVIPVVVVTATSAFPMLFAMRLGESQIHFHIALQATEFLGVHALDAIIVLFNVIVFRFLSFYLNRVSPRNRPLVWPNAMAILLVTTWFAYGVTSYALWDKKINSWDTLQVGIVQPNETPTLGIKTPYPGYSAAYPPEMEMTKRLASIGADVIVWPEASPKGYLNNTNIQQAYQRNMKAFDSNLLFQDVSLVSNPKNNDAPSQYNSAVMIDNAGQEVGIYNKLKRIPFGEYIPLLGDDALLKKWIEGILGSFLNEFSAGDEHRLFKQDKVNIVPLICYETTFPDFVANAVSKTTKQAEKANGTLLVGLSNDGWFGSTHQPYQHVMASVLRAVENRLPLVHVANNGPSIVVAPSGKVIFVSDFQRAGGYIANVPYDNTAQGSFYSRHPRLFIHCLYAMLVLMILSAMWRR